MIRTLLVTALAGTLLPATAAGPSDPAFLDHSLRRLHSDEVVNLRQRYAGQPLLVVNTASHCGFTGQFKGLEALHQQYKDRGLKVVGFPSDDFRQEAATESETAKVCFVNYGVSFDMYSPIRVSGEDAHPLFRELARQSQAPRWNFHKYVVDRNGKVIASFPSRIEPDSREVRAAIERAL